MKQWLLIALMAGGLQVRGHIWRPDDKFLAAVRFVESSDGIFTVGDAGRSLGDFQLSEAAWLDVSSWRKGRGLKTYVYDRHVFNQRINRMYAADYLTLIHEELSRKLKRAPNSGEIYAAYNMGLGTFATCNYKLTRVNAVTARKCEQIRELMRCRAR
jgi:hypothetical protein